ncbi:MAG: c-type cytochrome, partial [Gammaproteobacteria bacterium]|nr:c-type cytochrome [Gammaproteobacteria bacterium]
MVGLMSTPRVLFGADQPKAKELIQQNCVQCHRMEGQAESRFNLKAPDLIWAGSKYNRAWLIRWLTGKEAPLYVKGYRWDQSQEVHKHVTVSEAEANGIADYFAEHNKDPRVKV